MICDCKIIDDDNFRIEIFLNNNEQILYLSISRAQETMASHFYDTTENIDGKYPLTLSCKHYDEDDIFDIYFIDPYYISEMIESTDEYHEGKLLVVVDDKERIMKLTILDARKTLAMERKKTIADY